MKTKKRKSRKNPDGLSNHQKIAQNRGDKWKNNLRDGKLQAQLHPSLLKLTRLKSNLDQVDVARALDISESVYGGIERGRVPVKKDRAEKIASTLKRRVEDLFKLRAKSKKYVAKIIDI